MEARNIQGFKQEYPGMQFPNYRSLTTDESINIRKRLKWLAGLPENVDDLTLSKRIASLSINCVSENADDNGFDLIATLKRLNVTPTDQVFVNFYRFDDIDEMLISDVSRYFRFIWYPQSDDIDLFDHTLTWVLSISHDGVVSMANFVERQPVKGGQLE
jgi:hypothetical protein